MLCFTVSRPQALAALRAGLASLPHKPRPALVVGGGGVCAEEARALRATYQNGNLPRAVARLRRLAAA
jgi:hypothetical protein